MKTNYVTGASGFLGSHLVKSLNGNVETIPHSKITKTKLEAFDNFYFLSTYGNMYFHTDSDKIVKANVSDLIYIIKQASRQDFHSFVFMSTSSVRLPFQTMYSRTKRAAEEILLSYKEKHNLPICIIQPYSITGVGEQEKHLIPTLIRSCYTGEKVVFAPTPTHDFIDVEDVVEGILTLSRLGARGIFELGSGNKYTNKQVLEMVEWVTGRKANIEQVGRVRSYDNSNWVSNNLRARNFGWFPRKTLEMSIKEMVKEYERTRKKNT